MITHFRIRVQMGLTLVGLVLFLFGFLWIPLEHRISLRACEHADACPSSHGEESSPESPFEEHDSDACPICILALQMFDSVVSPVSVVEVDAHVASVLPFVPVPTSQAVVACFLARAPPVA